MSSQSPSSQVSGQTALEALYTWAKTKGINRDDARKYLTKEFPGQRFDPARMAEYQKALYTAHLLSREAASIDDVRTGLEVTQIRLEKKIEGNRTLVNETVLGVCPICGDPIYQDRTWRPSTVPTYRIVPRNQVREIGKRNQEIPWLCSTGGGAHYWQHRSNLLRAAVERGPQEEERLIPIEMPQPIRRHVEVVEVNQLVMEAVND